MKKIIYIDDEATAEKMLSRFEILNKQGIEIIQVDKVKDAMNVIGFNISSTGLIVLDIIMPPEEYYTLEETNGGTTTGLRLLKDIREKYPDIPIMIISIRRRQKSENLLKLYKVKEYLEKPISTAEIAIAIKLILSQYEKEK